MEHQHAHASIQTVVDYWNRRPCNIRHSSKAVGSREYFDEVEARKYFVEPHIPDFASFKKWSGKRVLEVGCGIGTDTVNFLRHGACLTAIDVSEESVAIAKKRLEIFDFDPDVVKVQNVEDFNSESKFDLIYSFGVIHHTPNPRRAIEKLSCLQNCGQELRLMLYSKFSYKLFWAMHSSQRWSLSKMDDIIREYAEAQAGCPVAFTYTFDQVRELLEPYYCIQSIHKDHIFRWDVEKYIRHEYELDEAWKGVPESTVKSMERELGWHTLIVAKRV